MPYLFVVLVGLNAVYLGYQLLKMQAPAHSNAIEISQNK